MAVRRLLQDAGSHGDAGDDGGEDSTDGVDDGTPVVVGKFHGENLKFKMSDENLKFKIILSLSC